MRLVTLIVMILMGFLLYGLAMGQPAEKGSEKGSLQERVAEKEEALLERMEALERSIRALRLEIERLEEHLKNIKTRPPLTAYKLPREVLLCGERFPLENRIVWETLDREFLVAVSNEVQVLLWMKRARRYFPHIEKRLKELGLPDDLKYVTITESSLRPAAVSSAGASGIWQFIPSTGEKHGLRRNRSIDERFDFLKATESALAYLQSLYGEFKTWSLAMAAYNVGENRVRKEVELQKTWDYFFLDLPMETKRYVYKIAVAKIILSDPGRYGFDLEEKEFYDPFPVERIQIELVQPLPIMDLAQAVGIFYKEIKELNLHFVGETIPEGSHVLNLPPGTSGRFWTFFNAWRKERETKGQPGSPPPPAKQKVP